MALLSAALVLAHVGLPAAAELPLSRPRPVIEPAPAVAELPLLRPKPAIEAVPAIAVETDHGPPTDCDRRLAPMAVFTPRPTLAGPGACGGADLVELEAVLLPDGSRVAVTPRATLRCEMAESFAAWLRDEVRPRLEPLDSPLKTVENADSYECRGRNRVANGKDSKNSKNSKDSKDSKDGKDSKDSKDSKDGRDGKVSEHGKGNAIDVTGFVLADRRKVVLTDVMEPTALREGLRDSACRRFTTVLGPGSDRYHEHHIHLDVLARRSGYRICQWAVRAPAPPPAEPPAQVASGEAVPLPPPRPPVPQARKL